MFVEKENSKSEILTIIHKIALSIKKSDILNERYVHHLFSHLLQTRNNFLELSDDDSKIKLHPEWPTYKKKTGINYGRYRKVNGCYKPFQKSNRGGFIDFAVGEYKKPGIGIEFTLKYGWNQEEIVYDFLKLLDKKNPFNISISYNIIIRKDKLSKGGYLTKLKNRMNDAYGEAVSRLNGNDCNNTKEIYFIVTEIGSDSRRHWYFDRQSGIFIEGFPKY